MNLSAGAASLNYLNLKWNHDSLIFGLAAQLLLAVTHKGSEQTTCALILSTESRDSGLGVQNDLNY